MGWFCPPISLTAACSEWIISDTEFRVGSSDSPARSLCDLCLPYITRSNNPTKGYTRQPHALSFYPLSPLSLRSRWPTTPLLSVLSYYHSLITLFVSIKSVRVIRRCSSNRQFSIIHILFTSVNISFTFRSAPVGKTYVRYRSKIVSLYREPFKA